VPSKTARRFPIEDPTELRAIAQDVMGYFAATDDGPTAGFRRIGEYPGPYAAAVAFMVASLEVGEDAYPPDRPKRLYDDARYALAVAQNRVGSVFSPHPEQPEWLWPVL
jgi:hypothetical protein